MTTKTRNHLAEKKSKFEGGATRSEKRERFDLIPGEAEVALAERFGIGATKHGPKNWQNGGVDFITATINHAKAHEASLLMNGPDHDDDDLAAILCNWSMLAWFRRHKPEEYRAALGFANPEAATRT